jgi:hypothetical protein
MPNLDTPLAAALIALIIALVKIVEKMIDWIFRKVGPKTGREPGAITVQLDPEVSKLIKETADDMHEVKMTMSRVDVDGTPMVYSSRKGYDALNQLASVVRDIATTQVRLAAGLDRLEAQFTAHDRADAITFNRIDGSITRVENVASSNHELLLRFGKDHEQALARLDKIQEEFNDHDRRVMEAVSLQKEIASKVK